MARHTPERYFSSDSDHGSSSGSRSGSAIGTTKKIASDFYHSVSAVMASCSKQAGRASSKFRSKVSRSRIAPKLPLVRSKQLLTNISNKAIPFLNKKKGSEDSDGGGRAEDKDRFGNGGVWQKSILMGDKCQPLDFSGVIYYDSSGDRLHELPIRSPRASPMPGYLYRK